MKFKHVPLINQRPSKNVPESSLNSSQRLALLFFLCSSEEELDALESSDDESSDDDSFAAQKRDISKMCLVLQ